MMNAISFQSVKKTYKTKQGEIPALDDLNLEVPEGSIYGFAGPNGAGKSSMLNVISGFYVPQEGEVWFRGKRRPQMKPYQVASQGIARTFQNIRLWGEMTALENVVVGTDARHKTSVPGALFRSARHRREERRPMHLQLVLLTHQRQDNHHRRRRMLSVSLHNPALHHHHPRGLHLLESHLR